MLGAFLSVEMVPWISLLFAVSDMLFIFCFLPETLPQEKRVGPLPEIWAPSVAMKEFPLLCVPASGRLTCSQAASIPVLPRFLGSLPLQPHRLGFLQCEVVILALWLADHMLPASWPAFTSSHRLLLSPWASTLPPTCSAPWPCFVLQLLPTVKILQLKTVRRLHLTELSSDYPV